jgi:hypothetical protein
MNKLSYGSCFGTAAILVRLPFCSRQVGLPLLARPHLPGKDAGPSKAETAAALVRLLALAFFGPCRSARIPTARPVSAAARRTARTLPARVRALRAGRPSGRGGQRPMRSWRGRAPGTGPLSRMMVHFQARSLSATSCSRSAAALESMMNASAAGMRYRSRCQAMPTMRGLTRDSGLMLMSVRYGSAGSQEMMAAPTPAAARPKMVALSFDRNTICRRSSGRPSRFSREWTSRIWPYVISGSPARCRGESEELRRASSESGALPARRGLRAARWLRTGRLAGERRRTSGPALRVRRPAGAGRRLESRVRRTSTCGHAAIKSRRIGGSSRAPHALVAADAQHAAVPLASASRSAAALARRALMASA